MSPSPKDAASNDAVSSSGPTRHTFLSVVPATITTPTSSLYELLHSVAEAELDATM
jgi:hypothetical protein